MPWWGWTLVGWTGLSIVLGLLIGRWRKSVRLTDEERAWPIRKADEQVPGKETAFEYSARCPVCDQERPLGGPEEQAWPIRKADEQVPGKETALYSARCPVCDQERPLGGPDGVIVHLLAIHPDSTEARWVMTQLGELARQLSADGASVPESDECRSRRPSQCVHRHRECPLQDDPPSVSTDIESVLRNHLRSIASVLGERGAQMTTAG